MATVPNISNTDRIVSYSPVAPTTAFVVPWPVIADSELAAEDDLIVIVNGAVVPSSGFGFAGNTIAGLTGMWNGGTVTLNSAASGVQVIIASSRDPQRTGNFLEGKAIPFTTLDKLIDDVIIQVRDLSLSVNRSFKSSLLNYLSGGSTEMTFSSGTLEATVAAFLAGISPGTAIAGWARTLAAGKALYPAPVVLANGHTMSVACRTATADGYGGIFSYDSADAASTFTSDALGFVDNQNRRWKRIIPGYINAKWFGAVGDGVTDDYAALVAARATAPNQSTLYVPMGTYMLSQQLNISNIGVIGDGPVATTFKPSQPFTGDSVLLIDDTMGGGGGVDSLYQNFRIYGNRAALSTVVAGLKLYGNVLYNQFSSIRINEVKGVGILIEGKAGPVRPTLSKWSNVHVNGGDSDGLKMNAGRHMTFDCCAFENLGGKGINVQGATESCSKIGFIRPYIEAVLGDGIYFGAIDQSEVAAPLVNGYGVTGVASYGFRNAGAGATRNKLVAGDFSKNASPHANSKHIYYDGGDRLSLENIAIANTDITVVGARGVVMSNTTTAASLQPISFTNGRAGIAAGLTRYLALNTGGQSATESDVRYTAGGYMHLSQLRAEATTLPSGTEQYQIVLMVNGIPTLLACTLTNANGSVGTDFSDEVLVNPADYISVRVITTAGATTIPQDGLHVSIGVRVR